MLPASLSSRITAVTGGGSGIGAARIRSLPHTGADVALLIDKDDDKVRAVAAKIVAELHDLDTHLSSNTGFSSARERRGIR